MNQIFTSAERKLTIVAHIPYSHQFVSDSQDAQAIRESVKGAEDYDSFFVLVGEGEYTSVYGMTGIVPRLSNLVSKLV